MRTPSSRQDALYWFGKFKWIRAKTRACHTNYFEGINELLISWKHFTDDATPQNRSMDFWSIGNIAYLCILMGDSHVVLVSIHDSIWSFDIVSWIDNSIHAWSPISSIYSFMNEKISLFNFILVCGYRSVGYGLSIYWILCPLFYFNISNEWNPIFRLRIVEASKGPPKLDI